MVGTAKETKSETGLDVESGHGVDQTDACDLDEVVARFAATFEPSGDMVGQWQAALRRSCLGDAGIPMSRHPASPTHETCRERRRIRWDEKTSNCRQLALSPARARPSGGQRDTEDGRRPFWNVWTSSASEVSTCQLKLPGVTTSSWRRSSTPRPVARRRAGRSRSPASHRGRPSESTGYRPRRPRAADRQPRRNPDPRRCRPPRPASAEPPEFSSVAATRNSMAPFAPLLIFRRLRSNGHRASQHSLTDSTLALELVSHDRRRVLHALRIRRK